MSTVKLTWGDIFSGPSDLIVLPCSTAGTITPFVRERLVHYIIPYPKPGTKLGDVNILPFKGAENIAQFVAYATSVKALSSSLEAIERIGNQLGKATHKWPTIRKISAPLLGAGAGGLLSEDVARALARGFGKTAHPDACLVIHILDRGTFERIVSLLSEEPTTQRGDRNLSTPMRVFISYCHTSPEHTKWVESLGTFLRENGIDARLDIWHLRVGMDLPQFMTNELALAERVIVVSDERYAEKADGRTGGVGWETMIIQSDMAKLPPVSTKYLVIVRSTDIDAGLPRYLKSRFVIHWTNGVESLENRKLLLRELYNVVRIPDLGSRPVFV